MISKKLLAVAALAGLAAGATQVPAAQAQESNKEVKCYGVNSCKAHAGCSVEADDVAAVKSLLGKGFASRFGKTRTHSCGAHASCGASSKILNWTNISEDTCKQQSGIVIDEKDGKKIARQL